MKGQLFVSMAPESPTMLGVTKKLYSCGAL